MANPRLKLLRVFFPSWRFFDTVQPIPKIQYRISEDGNTYSDWMDFELVRTPRKLKHLLHNPDENLRIALQIQFEQLLNDIAESKETEAKNFESLTSYKIVSTAIKTQILKTHSLRFQCFQFKMGVLIFSTDKRNNKPLWQDSIISPPQEV